MAAAMKGIKKVEQMRGVGEEGSSREEIDIGESNQRVSTSGMETPGKLELEGVGGVDVDEEEDMGGLAILAAMAIGFTGVVIGGQLLWRLMFGGGGRIKESKPNKALVWRAKRKASDNQKPLKLMVSENFKLKDATANNSLGGWSSRLETVSTPAKIVEALSERGINCVGKTVMDADCCDVISEGPIVLRNPSAPGQVCGGPCTGAAVAVAAGLADIAFGTDSIGGIRVPASCCGVVSFRSTKGLIPLDGIYTGSPTLDVLGFFAKDHTLLPEIGSLLNLPGKKDWKGEIVNIKIAKDLFQSWLIKDNREMYASLVTACLSWAGEGLVEEVNLSDFLANHAAGWEYFSESGRDIFEALRGVAICINSFECKQKQQPELVHDNNEEGDALYRKALAVKAAIQAKFKAGISGQSIVVFPALLKSPPSRMATNMEVAAFFRHTQQMCALASLVECPQINFPIHNRRGDLFSVGMVSLNKSDRQFLTTAGKLIGMIEESLNKTLEAPPYRGPLAPGAARKPETSTAAHTQHAAAERCKETGNDFFKQGKFVDAVRAYSEAIGLAPKNATYYNNRSMALIKLMHFSEAESDCNKALALDNVNAKALLRRGVARKAMNQHAAAKADFEQVLSIEPNNRQASQELKDILLFFESLKGVGLQNTQADMDSVKKARKEEGEEVDLEGEVIKALEKLESHQDALDKVNEEASEKVLSIQQEYSRIRRPLYAQRNQVARLVPDFWKTALQNHPVVRDLITEDDESALIYLTDIVVEDAEDVKSGFSIVFKFDQNPYFEDRELQKTVLYSEEGTVTVDGTPPKWLEGMGPTDDQSSGTKRNRSNVYSFFQWFVEAGTTENGHHDEIAAIIKDEIWPNPLKYYQEEAEDFEVSYPGEGHVEEEEEEEEAEEEEYDEGDYADEEIFNEMLPGEDGSLSPASNDQEKVSDADKT